jgi:hypothetical protein
VLGAPIRVHDMTGDDLGIAHVPTPVEPGDLILLERGEYRVLDVIPVDAPSPLYALVRAQPAHVQPMLTSEPASLNRVTVTRKGDFSPARPMMRIWGKGSGLRSAAPCLLGSGVRRVRGVRSIVNRCRRGFATCSLPGEKDPNHATTMSV